jgi:hypothetical protein
MACNAAMNRHPASAALLALAMTLLVACGGGTGTSTRNADQLRDYGAAVRWNTFDEAWAYVDPAIRASRPLTDFERERYKQVQVTGYEVLNQVLSPDGLALEQAVEIRLVNRNTQVERTFTDHQRWTYDAENRRWWLTSGLPDFFSR